MLRRMVGIVEIWGRHWNPQALAASIQMSDVLAGVGNQGSDSPWGKRSDCSSQTIATTTSVWGELLEFPLAQTGEGIAECEIVKWLVKEGDQVSRFQKICEIQSDKASMDITSPYEGKVRQVHYSSGDVVKVGETLLTIESNSSGESKSGLQPSPEKGSSPKPDPTVRSKVDHKSKSVSSPAVKHFTRESGVNASSIVGSGPDGRILKEDVVAAIQSQEPIQKPNPQEPKTALQGEPKRDSTVPPIIVPIRGYRRAMVKSMNQAAAIPHFHLCDEVSMGPLMLLRASPEGKSQTSAGKFSVLPFIIKALLIALQNFPDLNGSLSSDQSEILQHQHQNVGVAMATPDGLVVPNIKNVQSLSIREIGEQIISLKQKALAGKLVADDLAGGTITVSNIGTIGGTYATPLVSSPEAAIVALGKIRNIPVVSEKQGGTHVASRASMPITWGADHRVADGAMLAACNNLWKQLVEQPGQMLLHLR